MVKKNLFWYRRDLRLEDNVALSAALSSGEPVLALFIFDTSITAELPLDDARVNFIYKQLELLNTQLQKHNTSLLIKKGTPISVFSELIEEYDFKTVFVNRDYEPYGQNRDLQLKNLLHAKGIGWQDYKDHLIFEPGEVLKKDGKPYTVFTPFKNEWLKRFDFVKHACVADSKKGQFFHQKFRFPKLEELGFKKSGITVLPYNLNVLENYARLRDVPAIKGTSLLGPHLRFGSIGLRTVIKSLDPHSAGYSTFLSELIWREFFMHILWHFPEVVHHNFKRKYDGVNWRNNELEFEKWCAGQTGYPMVDAGMRELKQTGYMHNRVRMVTAGFLCKHLLIDWRWGEAYFAERLLDYELASNNGNWQWAAGTGCDAAPYFRVFNPTEQIRKFDSQMEYIKRWVPEIDTFDYPAPIVEHKFARERALLAYKKGLENQ